MKINEKKITNITNKAVKKNSIVLLKLQIQRLGWNPASSDRVATG